MSVRPLVLAAAGTAAAALLAACSGSASGHQMGEGATMGGASTAAAQSPAAATSPATSPAAGGRAADVAFAQSMVPHHRQAVGMADLALADASGASAQVRSLAGRIKAAQGPEIAQMAGWLTRWGAPTAVPGASGTDGMDGMDGMDGTHAAGMVDAEDMAALAGTRGAEFDRMWLRMMVAHHEGAVAMARQVLAGTADPEVEALARAVVDGQTAEIGQMRAMLAP